MWEVTIKGCVQSVFYTERIVYECECGNNNVYTGNIQPILCSNCNKILPDIQLLRKSKSMRVMCHCNNSGYKKKRIGYMKKILEL